MAQRKRSPPQPVLDSAADAPQLDPGNVEQVASERIVRETVTYVSNIYKYYVAYRLVLEENQRRAATKEALKAAGGRK